MISQAQNTTNQLIEYGNASSDQMSQAKALLEEKFNIDLRLLQRKFQMMEKEMEFTEEESFKNSKEALSEQVKLNMEMQEKSFKSVFSTIFQDYENSLDQEYDVNTKSIVFQHENYNKKELKIYKDSLENEFIEKDQQYKEASHLLEKLYYTGMILVI